ncbi:uncharacterized protein J4E84_000998 [Alternaria hordeiaustralica]|uniref:uncharacterized protein n=1 Tax=Alternaria hordeiaustralica TaxID=1187925 RepID=UPI0020C232FA|nr:uncharacterized protein J4E84_000998 [Alternaria hordeiaustralica]KAI4697865.1 hypothetical protein J4E84_000998 [Alternaria hordeiaustralica]
MAYRSKMPIVKIPARTPDTAMIALIEAGDDFETPNLRGDIVPIHVGNTPETLLHVHSTALSKSSEFFKNALKPEWRTDHTKPIDMSDVDPAIFEGYCGWLYTGKIMHRENDQAHTYLASLYVLGERLMDVTLQNSVVAAIIRHSQTSKKYPGNLSIQIIYAGTSASSPARRLLVDFWVFHAKPAWKGLEDLTKHTCSDFVNDLVRKLVEQREPPDGFVPKPWVADPESYKTK